jgi:hypothetical protein
MRLNSSRQQDFSLAAGVGFCLGAYVLLAVAFHWLMQPTVSENYGIAAYKPPPATVVPYAKTPFVPPTPELPSSSIAAEPLPSAAFAAEPPPSAAFAAAIPEVEEKPSVEIAKQAPTKHVARTTPRRQERTGRDRRDSWNQVSRSPYEFRSIW